MSIEEEIHKASPYLKPWKINSLIMVVTMLANTLESSADERIYKLVDNSLGMEGCSVTEINKVAYLLQTMASIIQATNMLNKLTKNEGE